jgi:hypothetical protein
MHECNSHNSYVVIESISTSPEIWRLFEGLILRNIAEQEFLETASCSVLTKRENTFAIGTVHWDDFSLAWCLTKMAC